MCFSRDSRILYHIYTRYGLHSREKGWEYMRCRWVDPDSGGGSRIFWWAYVVPWRPHYVVGTFVRVWDWIQSIYSCVEVFRQLWTVLIYRMANTCSLSISFINLTDNQVNGRFVGTPFTVQTRSQVYVSRRTFPRNSTLCERRERRSCHNNHMGKKT